LEDQFPHKVEIRVFFLAMDGVIKYQDANTIEENHPVLECEHFAEIGLLRQNDA